MPTTLRRSCDACARAKRRCDLSAPRCSRCGTKDLDCTYVNQPAPGPPSRSGKHHKTAQKHQALRAIGIPRHPYYSVLERGPTSGPHPYIPEVVRLFSPATLERQLDILQAFAADFAQNSAAPFVHRRLYGSHLPEPLQHASRICAARGLKDPQTSQLLRRGAKAASFPDLLAHVQAIALTQTTRLLHDPSHDPDRDDRALWVLAQLLWKRAPTRLPRALSPWRAWVFAESVRRTILACHVVLAVRGVLRRGFAAHLMCAEALPFDMRWGVWEAEGEDGWEAATGAGAGLELVSMRQFAALKGPGEGVSPFEELLLLSFRGGVTLKS